MTIRLLRHLHHNVTKPVLRVKHDLLRTALGKPARRAETPPATAASASPVPAPAEAPKPARPAKNSTSSRTAKATQAPKTTSKQDAPGNTAKAQRTKAELYEEATRRNIKGRSTMTKAQLASALAEG